MTHDNGAYVTLAGERRRLVDLWTWGLHDADGVNGVTITICEGDRPVIQIDRLSLRMMLRSCEDVPNEALRRTNAR